MAGLVFALAVPSGAWATVQVINITLADLNSPGGFFAAIAEPNAPEVGLPGSDEEPVLDIVIAGATWSLQGGIFLTDPGTTDPHCPGALTGVPCFSDVIKFVNDSSGTANLWFASDEADQISQVPNVVNPKIHMVLGETRLVLVA